MKNKQASSIIYRLSEIEDEDLRSKLELQYMNIEGQKRLAVENSRAAQRAALQASRSMVDVQLAELDFVIHAGEAFEQVSTEPLWMVRRSVHDVILECPMSMEDVNNLHRAQAHVTKTQVNQINKDPDADTGSMFREE